jgi:hypothetical protein
MVALVVAADSTALACHIQRGLLGKVLVAALRAMEATELAVAAVELAVPALMPQLCIRVELAVLVCNRPSPVLRPILLAAVAAA